MKISILLTLALLLPSPLLPGAGPTGHVGELGSASTTAFRPGKDFALFFAVNDYQQMRDLQNPIANAKAIATDLEELYGFTTEVVENPTLDDIERELYEYKVKFAKNPAGQYQSEGQLLIFFTGHGIMENNVGYFCPSDVDPARIYRTALGYDYWRNFLDGMDCKHILVAIDACYSGWFDPSWQNKPGETLGKRPGEMNESEKLLANHERYITRWFMTSATNVESPDDSNFTYQFREGLKTFGGEDGILTSSELWTKLELANPKPHQGRFGKNEPESNFLFILKNPLPNLSQIKGADFLILSDEDNYLATISKADKYFSQSEWDEASKSYQLALRYKPNDAYAQKQIDYSQNWKYQVAIAQADKYFDQGVWETALKNYQVSLNFKPSDSYAQARIDSCLQKKYEEAVAQGDKYFGQGVWETALKNYQVSLNFKPGDPYVQTRIDSCLQKKYEEAVVQGDKFWAQGNYDASVKSYFTALEINPNDSYAHCRLDSLQQKNLITDTNLQFQIAYKNGLLFSEQGDFVRASRQFRKALAIDPKNAECQNGLKSSNLQILSSKTEIKVRVICSGGEFHIEEIPASSDEDVLTGMTVKLTDPETGNYAWAQFGKNEGMVISSFVSNRKYSLMLLGSAGQMLFNGSFTVPSADYHVVELIMRKH